MAKDPIFFVLETYDLVRTFEQAVGIILPADEKMELMSQIVTLLRCHHPCDLSSREMLVLEFMPSLYYLSEKDNKAVKTYGNQVICNDAAYALLIGLYKRLQHHYLYDQSHLPHFIIACMVGDNLVLKLN